ncbi:hypothetical protein PSPTOT1_2277 [Pseudomonas syringae pv. tomato T1]|nr:hypothetical protein PSPTOT1_2277 [Pseudomonas syringae pv. tomato T1]
MTLNCLAYKSMTQATLKKFKTFIHFFSGIKKGGQKVFKRLHTHGTERYVRAPGALQLPPISRLFNVQSKLSDVC